MIAMAFNIALNAFLIGSFALFVWFLFKLAVGADSQQERFLRVIAIFVGALITMGAAVSGVTTSTFTASSLAEGRAASAAASATSALIPALLGFGVGFLITRTVSKGGDLAMRIMCLVGSLAVTAFIGIYIASVNVEGLLLGPNAVPNVAFVVGVLLTVILTLKAPDESVGNRQSIPQMLNDMRESVGGALGRDRNGDAAAAAAPPPSRRSSGVDPFDVV